MSDFYAIVQGDNIGDNPTLEITGQNHDMTITTTREMTIEEMERLANDLLFEARALREERRGNPGWAHRSYTVGGAPEPTGRYKYDEC